MTLREYKSMSYSYKKGLRREYKLRFTDEYYYSVKIKALLLVGIAFALISILYAFKFNMGHGLIFFGLFGIYSIFMLVLVFKSNRHFEYFLTNLSHNKKSS